MTQPAMTCTDDASLVVSVNVRTCGCKGVLAPVLSVAYYSQSNGQQKGAFEDAEVF